MTTMLSHERYCSAILDQTGLLCSALGEGADVSVTVPTCPEWTLGHLLLHVGQAHRMATELVRDQVMEFVPPAAAGQAMPVPGPGAPSTDDLPGLTAWLTEGAEALVAVLREAGPDSPVWTFAEQQTSAFWARRAAHETLMHRADALGAVGVPFAVEPELAADCVDEWLGFLALPAAVAFKPRLKELPGPGRTLHLHATDTPAELNAEWFIDLTGEAVAWRRAHEKAAVAVRGPMTDVLSVLFRRLPAGTDRVEVLGDRELLDFWLERAVF
ncbi:maleylpyruvate isomerase family mycothiol-dependent enzyme [Streptomyces roseoverticillatus]|uniref:maleylpyruvate isomerase family mycothiol-dependent enzyme n=1 Tax=Streptomyces roseoverticillatus TaxID=66429 RepID=UPI001F1EF1C3|nr:maleylpyruvate isomerase family mycothiol-dependent enzyme [Streptomyces roseoverticillatus]MCF3104454.1 maleylpyruvate isomerase family mycothiol-dependent enzyme [Streptomyces roseoverticillatus]